MGAFGALDPSSNLGRAIMITSNQIKRVVIMSLERPASYLIGKTYYSVGKRGKHHS
jgi:hypothetical protein